MVAAFRADGAAEKVVADWDLLERTFRETWYSNRARAFRAEVIGHDQQGLIKYIRGTLNRKGMWFRRTLPPTRASWEELVPQPRQWDADGSTDPIDIVDPELLTQAWQRTRRAGSSNQMTDEELTISGVCMISPGRFVELAVVRSSRPLALIVIGSCAEVRDVPTFQRFSFWFSIHSQRNTRNEVCANV